MAELHDTKHTSFNHVMQRELDRHVQKDMRARLHKVPAHELAAHRQRQKGQSNEVPSEHDSHLQHEADWGTTCPNSFAAGESKLVSMLEAQRAKFEANLLPKVGMPRPLVRVALPKPSTPPGEDSEAWQYAAKKLERGDVVKVMNALQDRLESEERRRRKAEERLQRKIGGPPKSASAASLSPIDHALAVSASRNYGLYGKDAAGFRPDEDSLERWPQPRGGHRLRRARPLSCGSAPWATRGATLG